MENPVDIVQISEKEYLVAKNKVVIQDKNIVFIEAHGGQTDEIAKAHLELNKTITCILNGNVKLLIDLNDAGKSSTEARKIWQKIAEFKSTKKVALFGMHPVAKVLASFVIGVTSNKNILFFSRKDKALDWLLTDND